VGMKYSPIFGRYSFLNDDSEGNTISVGDEVFVSRRNGEHTKFGEFQFSDTARGLYLWRDDFADFDYYRLGRFAYPTENCYCGLTAM